jgi:hypothetical protein
MGSIEDKQLLWCLLCSNRFTVRDAEEGRYRGGTGICMECYTSMAKSTKTCFGKQSGEGLAGYDESAEECLRFCPDRKVCKEFVTIQKRLG